MDVFDAIAKEVDEKVEQLKEYLASGRTTNHEEYKHLCGQITGLLYVRGYALDLKRQLENSDE